MDGGKQMRSREPMTPRQSIAKKTAARKSLSQNAMNCLVCREPLKYSGSGRRPSYCSSRCKKKAAREKARFGPLRRQRTGVSDPVSALPKRLPSPELTQAEKEALVGRPLYSGDWQGWLEATGRGFPR